MAGNYTENKDYDNAPDEIMSTIQHHKKNQSNLIKPLELSKISTVQEKESYSKNASVLCFPEDHSAINNADHYLVKNQKLVSNTMGVEKKKFLTVELENQENNCYIDKEPEQLLTLRNQEIFQFSQEE